MLDSVINLLSNHWIVTLFISPIVGVVWANILSNRHQANTRATEYAIQQNQNADIDGDGNIVNQQQTVNNTKHIHYGNSQQNSDGGAEVIALFVLPIAVLCIATFLFANFGGLMLLWMKVIFSFSVVSLISYWWMNKNTAAPVLNGSRLSIWLIMVGVAFVSAELLKSELHPQAIQIASQYTNPFEFFFSLSTDERILFATQSLGLLFLLISQIFIAFRMLSFGKLDQNGASFFPDAVSVLFVSGFCLFFSWPDLSTNLLITFFL